MKKITIMLALLSCIISKTTLPLPINMEIIGKDGKSMVTSKSDSITISYTENGVAKSFHPNILTLQNATDGSTASNYNGLVINDNAVMSDLSSQTINPVHNFNINLNGVDLSVIYVDYWKYEAAFP
ncbi:hypothetical protein, partial [Mucilaginibacter sp. L196]|uniref:hypothetical protein n=1 Tax=Mucilaginibacter sp. L196 TaxID=1641870 RepID=UPI00131D6813